MKLLHITATHLKPDGGVPVVLKELVTAQNRIENVTSIVISLVASVDAMNSEYFEYVPKNRFERFVLENNPNFVILHSFYYFDYNHVVRVLTKHRIPYFIEPHGSFGKAAMKKSWLKKKIANNTIFRKQLKNSFGYIFLNNSEKEDSIYHTNHDLIIPNGINTESVIQIVKKKKDFAFYFIGRYDINHKGLDYMLDAFEILDQRKYTFVINMWGSGDEVTVNYIKKKIKDFKYISVNCNTSIYGKEKNEILEQYGPMILTSRYEGFPMTILEAWAYGNPCIVTPGTNVFNEVIDNNLGWGVQLNVESIATGLVIAAKNYEENRNGYIELCKKYVIDNYTWDRIAEKSISSLKML